MADCPPGTLALLERILAASNPFLLLRMKVHCVLYLELRILCESIAEKDACGGLRCGWGLGWPPPDGEGSPQRTVACGLHVEICMNQFRAFFEETVNLLAECLETPEATSLATGINRPPTTSTISTNL